MVPTRSTRSSSRRSSILKTPKRRQPLQNLNFDKSSNESSPATTTGKIKRRVSFAEKKHVKEFCTSVEQGTVWDNTYEEHDLSSISKVPCRSNEQQFEDKDMCKENTSIHSKENNVQFSWDDPIKEGLHVEQINVQVEDVVKDIRYQTEMTGTVLSDQFHDAQENENVCSIALQLESNSLVSRSISVYEDESIEMSGKVVELSQSRAHNFLCNKLSSKSVQSTCTEFTQDTHNSEYIDINYIQNNRIEDIVKDKSISVQQFNIGEADIVQDVSMEFTTIATANAKRGMDRDEDKTKRLDISMEITTPVPVEPYNLQLDYNKTNRCFTNLLSEDKENRTVYLNDSVEMTEVPQKFHRSTVIQKTPLNKYNNMTEDEITKVLNTSMEMTEAVPINVHSIINTQDRNGTGFNNNFKKLKRDPEVYDTVRVNETRYCDDEVMELTTVVTSPKSTEETQHLCSPTSIKNRTDIFLDDSMTMTKVVSSLGTNDCPEVESVPDLIKPASERTLPNTSMQITEAVLRARNATPTEDLIRCTNFVCETGRKSLPEVDLQKSMEITEAIRSIRASTTVDLLKSMEITEAVSRPQTLFREDPQTSMELTEAVRRVQSYDESETLLKSMEITEAVSRPQTLLREDPQTSMELTEAVRRVQSYDEREILLKSMEMTEAVTRPQTLLREDPQTSMELTEAVRRVQSYDEREILLKSMEITEAVTRPQTLLRQEPQTSMELTEAVRRVQPYDEPETLLKSMEMTEAVSRPQTLLREEPQTSMELTEAVRRVQPYDEPETLVKSMEMTEAVSRPQTLLREDPQTSMELTEAVRRVQPYDEPETLLKSMEMTEAVSRPQTLLREDSQKSMEITEAVRPIQAPDEIDLLKSMEITEAVTRAQTRLREENLHNSMELTEAVRRVQSPVESETRLKSMVTIEAPISVETAVQEDSQKSTGIMKSVKQERSRTRDVDASLAKTKKLLEEIGDRNLTGFSNLEKNNVTDFGTISNKENCNVYNSIKNVENDVAEESGSIQVQSFANSKPNTALHEPMQLDNCASALKTSNAGVACAALNSVSSLNSEIKIPVLTLTKSSHRRTYVIQPLVNDRTFTVNSDRNNISAEIDSDINNKEADSSQSDIKNSQNGEVCDIENSKVFMASDLEDIESIKPPSFVCLDDLSDIPMNNSDCQEIMEEATSPSNNDNRHEHAPNFEHREANVLENVPKSQTFLIKNTDNTLNSSKIEQEHRLAETDVILKPQLSNNGDINMDIKNLECSSSTINGNENAPPLNTEKILQPSCTLNSKLENRDKACTSSKIRSAHESEIKESNDEAYDDHSLSVEVNVIRKLKVCAKRDDIIWEMFYEDLDNKKLFVVGFISCSLLVVVYLQERSNFRSIKEVKLISRLLETADVLIHMVHRLIIEKIDTAQLLSRFSVYDDILPLLDYVSKEVKIAMDFMFDLERLKYLHLMEFTRDSVSFVSFTDRRGIILKVTVNIKPFEKIGPEDISVHPLYGSLRDDNTLRKLITNVKRDHKFLRRFIQDVKSYICIEEDFLSQT